MSLGYTNHFDEAALSDPDGDRFLNWQEYHADTDPTNAASFLSIAIDSTNLTFDASSNCSYSIEWNENLPSNAWNTLISDVSGISGISVFAYTNSAPFTAYRLKAWRN